jgi:hypothetical protein
MIEWVISVLTLMGSLYIFMPFHEFSVPTASTAAIVLTVGHSAVVLVWAAVLVAGASLVIAGLLLNKSNFKSVGWFSIFLARFFQVLNTWIVSGLFPITWIYPFTISIVVSILWVAAKRGV